jgi:hypothetical protein
VGRDGGGERPLEQLVAGGMGTGWAEVCARGGTRKLGGGRRGCGYVVVEDEG